MAAFCAADNGQTNPNFRFDVFQIHVFWVHFMPHWLKNKKQKNSSKDSSEQWKWKGMVENLQLAHQELTVITDLIETVQANDAVAVAGMTRPKPMPNEILSDLAVSTATKLLSYRNLGKYFKQSAKALEQKINREARFYGALIRILVASRSILSSRSVTTPYREPKDLGPHSTKELESLEGQLDSSLKQIRALRTQFMLDQLNDLQSKERMPTETNKTLRLRLSDGYQMPLQLNPNPEDQVDH